MQLSPSTLMASLMPIGTPPRGGQGGIEVAGQVGSDGRIHAGDAILECADGICRREVAAAEACLKFRNGEIGDGAHFLFNHFGHDDKVVCAVRGIGENDFSVQAGMRHVFAEYIKYRVRVSCGFDLGDIQCPQLLHVFQHPTELGLEFSGFFVGEFDAGQSGYIADIKIGTAHAEDIGRSLRPFCPKV